MILEIFAIKGLRFEQFHLEVGQNRVFGDFGVFSPKRVFGGQGTTPQGVKKGKIRNFHQILIKFRSFPFECRIDR